MGAANGPFDGGERPRSNEPVAVVIGADSRRVRLLVVPPATPGRTARAVRSAADAAARVADILGGSSASSTPDTKDKQATHPAPAVPQQGRRQPGDQSI
nr:hypothetical protein [Kibdelosporangium sp. MJ126-NF4]